MSLLGTISYYLREILLLGMSPSKIRSVGLIPKGSEICLWYELFSIKVRVASYLVVKKY